MSEAAMTRRDRIFGWALLVLAIVVAFVPNLESRMITTPWFCAGILLLTMNYAARPNPKLIRWGAAILFVGGFAALFVANFIDSSLGA